MVGFVNPLTFVEQDSHLLVGWIKVSQDMAWGISRVANGPRSRREIILFGRYTKSALLKSGTHLGVVVRCQLIKFLWRA